MKTSLAPSKQLNLLLPLIPKTLTTNPSLFRHLCAVPNHPSPPPPPPPPPSDDSSVITQVVSLLQNPNNDLTTSNSQLHHLLPSLSPPSLLKITRQLGTTAAALKFFQFLRTSSAPPPDPLSLPSTFQAIFELATHERPSKLLTEKKEKVKPNSLNKLSELFSISKELNIPLTINSATLLVRSFGRARMVEEALLAYNYLDPELRNTKVLNVVIDVLLKSGRVHDALKLLDEMLEPSTNVPPNENTSDTVFGELSRGNVSEEEIVELVSKFGKHGVFPSEMWLSQLIIQFCRKGNTNSAWEILHEAMKLGGIANVGSCNALLKGLHIKGDFKRMNMLLQDMKDNNIQPNVVTFGILIYHLCKVRRIDVALDVFKKMSEGSDGILVKPDVILYNTLIDGLCKVGRQEEGLGLMEQMRLQHECVPNTVTFNCLIDGFCKSGEIERSQELFDRMNKEGVLPNVITINTLVDGLCKHGRVNTAVEFFNEMRGKGLKGNVVTYATLINAFCNANNIGKAMNLFDEMLENGCSLDAIVYYTLISGLTKAGKLDDASFVVSKMKQAGFQLDIVCYNILIGGFCRRKKLDKVYELLKDMEQAEVKPDGVTYNTLISFFSENGDFKTGHKVMKKMVADGCVPTVVTYGALIHAYCLAGNLDDAIKLFDDMGSASKIPPNTVIYNILIDSLCKNNKVEDALSMIDDMKAKGVRPNTTTFNATFKGLRDKNWLNKALILMDQMTEQACNPDYITMEILTDWLPTVGKTEKLQSFLQGYKISSSLA